MCALQERALTFLYNTINEEMESKAASARPIAMC